MALNNVVLVLRALGLGDLLTAVPALRALRRAHPGAHLVLAAPKQLAELVWLIDAVDELWPTAGLGALHWSGPPPRLAVNLHGSGPESIADLLAVRPRRMLTHRHRDHPDVPGPAWCADRHEVDRWCRLTEYAGIAADRADLRLPRPDRPSPCAGAAIVHPGAASPARRWPPDRFAEVAAALAAGGNRVAITGSAAERGLALRVASAAGLPESAVLAAGTGLGELAAVVAEASLVLCGDTGIGHLATAYATPSVLLFGPTPPARWGPPAGSARHRVLWAGDVDDPYGDRPAPGLLRLTVPEVLEQVRQLRAGQFRAGRGHGVFRGRPQLS
jgi:ADP-heptose:LPS heptosyltransferase